MSAKGRNTMSEGNSKPASESIVAAQPMPEEIAKKIEETLKLRRGPGALEEVPIRSEQQREELRRIEGELIGASMNAAELSAKLEELEQALPKLREQLTLANREYTRLKQLQSARAAQIAALNGLDFSARTGQKWDLDTRAGVFRRIG
jgi:chromosome segregation ATPase